MGKFPLKSPLHQLKKCEKITLMIEKAYLTDKKPPQNATQKMPSAFFVSDPGNRHTPTTARETLSVLTDKCGTVRGQIKSPFMKKCFRPKATGNYTYILTNHVNYQIAYISSLQFFSWERFVRFPTLRRIKQ